jgi:hypothetical protein
MLVLFDSVMMFFYEKISIFDRQTAILSLIVFLSFPVPILGTLEKEMN